MPTAGHEHNGHAATVMLSLCRLLGVGGSYPFLSWQVLTYHTGPGGYVVDLL